MAAWERRVAWRGNRRHQRRQTTAPASPADSNSSNRSRHAIRSGWRYSQPYRGRTGGRRYRCQIHEIGQELARLSEDLAQRVRALVLRGSGQIDQFGIDAGGGTGLGRASGPKLGGVVVFQSVTVTDCVVPPSIHEIVPVFGAVPPARPEPRFSRSRQSPHPQEPAMRPRTGPTSIVEGKGTVAIDLVLKVVYRNEWQVHPIGKEQRAASAGGVSGIARIPVFLYFRYYPYCRP